MKTLNQAIRISFAVAMAFILSGLSTSNQAHAASKTLGFSTAEKHVHITVEIHGKIDDHTAESVEEMVSDWLEAAHFVVEETAGAKVLELHVVLTVNDDHHFSIHEDCGDWEEDKEAAVLDALDETLHRMINDFIKKFGH